MTDVETLQAAEATRATLRASEFGRTLPRLDEIDNDVGEFSVRNRVLLETLQRLEEGSQRYHHLSEANAARWAAAVAGAPPTTTSKRCKVEVLPGDWGDVTLQMSKKYGTTFACLNMANAYAPGGGYVDGMIAQEENMFRRTDCHFSLKRDELHFDDEYYMDWMYKPEHSALLNAEAGHVYLDTEQPRVCIRGPEDRTRDDLGYAWLPDDEVFRFYELRAAAVDLRDGRPYDHAETVRRVGAQLDTLVAKGVRHAVLSAFGCGAFRNPAFYVAGAYREALESRATHFEVVAFGIFHAGYGPNNFAPFAKAFEDWDTAAHGGCHGGGGHTPSSPGAHSPAVSHPPPPRPS